MNKTPFILFGIFALICVIVIPVVALGKNGDEDAATVKVASRDRHAQELFATKDRQSVLGTYSIDSNGDTTLTDYGAYNIANNALKFRATIKAKTS